MHFVIKFSFWTLLWFKKSWVNRFLILFVKNIWRFVRNFWNFNNSEEMFPWLLFLTYGTEFPMRTTWHMGSVKRIGDYSRLRSWAFYLRTPMASSKSVRRGTVVDILNSLSSNGARNGIIISEIQSIFFCWEIKAIYGNLMCAITREVKCNLACL